MFERIGVLVALFLLFFSFTLDAKGIHDWTDHYDGRLKIGGEVRFRIESRQDYDFDSSADNPAADDRFLLSRIRINFDVNPIDPLRFFAEIQDSRDYGVGIDRRSGGGAFEDRVDFFQLFADIKNLTDFPMTVRLGRQTLAFGDQRLVGAFGWSNVGRSFQGVRVIIEPEPVDVNFWVVDVVVPEDGELNEATWSGDFIGTNLTWKNVPQGRLDTYFLMRDRGDETWIYTVGGRFKGDPLADGKVDYDAEFAFQTGEYSEGIDQIAIAFHGGAGYTLKQVTGNPRLGFQYNFATGDSDPNDTENKTFDNLFPTNHLHYGYIDFLSWRNMHNVKIESSMRPVEKLLLKGDFHIFWLKTVRDAWYNAGGGVIRRLVPDLDADASIGREIDITARYTHNRHFNVMAGFSYFLTGSFVEATGSSDNPSWFYLMTSFPF
jgi:hypothetical protein